MSFVFCTLTSLEPHTGTSLCVFSCTFSTSFRSCYFMPVPFCNLWSCKKVTEELAFAGSCRNGRFQMTGSQVGMKDCQECFRGFHSFVFRQGAYLHTTPQQHIHTEACVDLKQCSFILWVQVFPITQIHFPDRAVAQVKVSVVLVFFLTKV